MSTETEIANRALSLLGEPAINALDDGTAPARAIGLHFEPVRDALLRSHPWDFAIVRVELSINSEAPLFGWGYSYALPSDCLRVVEFNEVLEENCRNSFAIEGNNLVTDSGAARIAYVRRVTDPTQFDALFLDAFTHKLAAAIGPEITGNRSVATSLETRAAKILKEARFVDAQGKRERVRDPLCESRGANARRRRPTIAGYDHITTVVGPTGPQGEQGIQGIQGIQGATGATGATGADGNDGWTPVLAIVSDGARRVQQVVDWTGGEGTKPATGQYVGATGLVSAIGDGVDIRGETGATGATGSTGATGATGAAGADSVSGIRYERGANSSAPSPGEFTVDNATWGSVTQIRFNTQNLDLIDVETWLDSAVAGDSIYIITPTTSAWLLISNVNSSVGEVSFDCSTAPQGNIDAVGEVHGVFIAKKGATGGTGAPGTNGTNGTNGADGADGVTYGLAYQYSTTTTNSDPGAGFIRFDNTTLSSATHLYIDEVDGNGVNVASYIGQWTASNSSTKATLFVIKKSDASIFHVFSVTGIGSAPAGWDDLTVSHLSGSGTLSNNDEVILHVGMAGDKGDTGADGNDSGFRYTFSTTTTDSDPGSGTFRFNNIFPGLATYIFLDNETADGADIRDYVSTWDDSDSSVRGVVTLIANGDPSKVVVYNITGSSTHASGYMKVLVSNVVVAGGSSPFSNGDDIMISFSPSGNKGADGANGSGCLKYGYAQNTTQTSTTSTIPFDNTIPQNTEGTELMTLSYTPASASSNLEIEFTCFTSGSGLLSITFALFVDSTANALAATGVVSAAANYPLPVVLRCRVASGSTSARTYKIRYGPSSGTAYVNQRAAEATFGGVAASLLTVKEFS